MPAMSADWIILGYGGRLRWGGDLRRHFLFKELGIVTRSPLQPSWNREALTTALAERPSSRPRLASVELLDRDALELAVARTSPTLVDLHDEPIRQKVELGEVLPPEAIDGLRRLVATNVAAFRYVVMPTPEFAALAGVDKRDVLVAPPGTDTRLIKPGPWPEVPTVGMVSGASPRRGIEDLIEACRRLRPDIAGLRLRLVLVGTTDEGRSYLEALRASVAEEEWISIENVPYQKLSPLLAETTVLVLPQPSGAYFDVALPMKLFDYFAAGRPIVTTPRTATAERVVQHGAGLVTRGDEPDDLAATVGRVLREGGLGRRLGAAGRAAAVSTYDWRVIGRHLAYDVMLRVDKARWLQLQADRVQRRLLR
jgi:glycosyltransferase involved in cell wall biosynthesis